MESRRAAWITLAVIMIAVGVALTGLVLVILYGSMRLATQWWCAIAACAVAGLMALGSFCYPVASSRRSTHSHRCRSLNCEPICSAWPSGTRSRWTASWSRMSLAGRPAYAYVSGFCARGPLPVTGTAQ